MILEVLTGIVIGVSIGYFLQFVNLKTKKSLKEDNKDVQEKESPIIVYYGTQRGTSKNFAFKFKEEAAKKNLKVIVRNLKDFEPEEFCADVNGVHLFIISTYSEGTPPEDAQWFHKWLSESSNDFRVSKTLLNGMKYAVFGLGHSLYSDFYITPAKDIDKWLHKLSGIRIHPVADGNEYTPGSKHGTQAADFDAWCDDILSLMEDININLEVKTKLVKEEQESDDEEQKEDDLVDVEDVGEFMMQYDNKTSSNGLIKRKIIKKKAAEMITPELRKALTKQGYKLIGSHSGVKLCRWTKSMLRGRGGCYKHTFYGIESHRCMETTPSLACANKCVFCWRHHTNPVGTEWRWKQDPADVIVDGAITKHYEMIKQFKGVPGVKPQRFAEGFSIQHCALSLVGEPIMYPEINKFLTLLHEKGISSFLVTNAQFPDAITNLLPVTQLYVSVDAATQDSLKKIDRPLFKDFWPRFIDSLKALSAKGQRTVYRLTVVKSWNSEEIQEYGQLVKLGKPDFIEVKGVTYCGDNKSNAGLTMKNVPWHDEVVGFVQQLADSIEGYEIACEHEHSNCVLLASTKFKIGEDKWNTWIDYEKFHQLYQRFESTGESFTAEDYMAPTPSWAVIGSEERGFDPIETRWHRKSKVTQGC